MIDAGHASLLSVPGAVPLSGGAPVDRDGTLLGAIGISGATGDVDEAIASTAAKVFLQEVTR